MSRKVDTYRRLRALMLELGHDQTSLGKRTGMSRQQISDRMIQGRAMRHAHSGRDGWARELAAGALRMQGEPFLPCRYQNG